MKKYRIRKVTIRHENGTTSYEYYFEKRVALLFWDNVGFARCYQLSENRWAVYPLQKMICNAEQDLVAKEFMERFVKYFADVKSEHALVPVFYPEGRLYYLTVWREDYKYRLWDVWISEYMTKTEPKPFDQAVKEYAEAIGIEVVGKRESHIYSETL